MTAVSPHSSTATLPDDLRLADLTARDALVLRYQPYVRKLAFEIAEALAFRADVDDLVSWGLIGLINAAARYEPDRGVTFLSYAHLRIRGAIYDGIRRELGPSHRFSCLRTGTSWESAGVEVLSADSGYDAGRRLNGDVAIPTVPAASLQYPRLFRQETRAHLREALSRLDPKERDLIVHAYLHGKPAMEFAREARLSKSWISRLHARALRKLRCHLLMAASSKEAFV